MVLPLVSSNRSGMVSALPSAGTLQACIELATTPEAAQYLVEQFTERLGQTGLMKKSPLVLDEIREFAKKVQYQSDSRSNPWTGDTNIATDYQNVHHHLANEAIADIRQKEVTFHYAISDASQIIRGYANGLESLDDNDVDAMDVQLNAWFAEHDMVNQDGVIYQADKQGEIKRNAKGELQKVDSDHLRQLITSKTDGFDKFVQRNNKEMQVTMRNHPYTEPKVVQEEVSRPG